MTGLRFELMFPDGFCLSDRSLKNFVDISLAFSFYKVFVFREFYPLQLTFFYDYRKAVCIAKNILHIYKLIPISITIIPVQDKIISYITTVTNF